MKALNSQSSAPCPETLSWRLKPPMLHLRAPLPHLRMFRLQRSADGVVRDVGGPFTTSAV